jgi:hypothetical protein
MLRGSIARRGGAGCLLLASRISRYKARATSACQRYLASSLKGPNAEVLEQL